MASSILAIGGLMLAAKRRIHGVFLFATLLGFYPLIYYFTFPTPRYRHAIDPELVILAVFLISSFPVFRPRRQTAVRSERCVRSTVRRLLKYRPWVGYAHAIITRTQLGPPHDACCH
jgi:hypothetical protein